MTRVFLSWSGERSRRMANSLAAWLPRIIQNCRTWTSDRNIEKGQRWFEEIGKTLEEHHFGIICTTPENYTAPWLLFEAGALSKSIGRSRVCPLLLGLSPSELKGPLLQFQATVVAQEDMLKLVNTINAQMGDARLDKDILMDCFHRFWKDIEADMTTIAKVPIPGGEFAMPRVVEAFAKHGLPLPVIGSEAHFTSGYESHGLYSTVMEIARERLFIIGRKNRKVFDKEHQDFMGALKQRIANGLDFRVLFLDPDSPEHIIRAAHRDEDFRQQLQTCIESAVRSLERSGVAPKAVCRKYSTLRVASIVVVDDAVLFSPVRLSPDGRAETDKGTVHHYQCVDAAGTGTLRELHEDMGRRETSMSPTAACSRIAHPRGHGFANGEAGAACIKCLAPPCKRDRTMHVTRLRSPDVLRQACSHPSCSRVSAAIRFRFGLCLQIKL